VKSSDRIRAHVEEEISSGRWLPGDTIDEGRLASLFDVSRTPVREALLQLSAQGWVTAQAREGYSVAKMSLQQLLSLWELLSELEGVAARLACERMNATEIDALEAIHQTGLRAVEQDDLDGWQQANLDFHEQIYAGARNPFLRQEVLRIRFRTGAYRRHAFAALGRLNASYAQHQTIVEAFRAREPQRAMACMVEHMRPGRDARSLNDFVVNLPAELLAAS
jgi:DNA-binding GntR family transcriptional regulator